MRGGIEWEKAKKGLVAAGHPSGTSGKGLPGGGGLEGCVDVSRGKICARLFHYTAPFGLSQRRRMNPHCRH